LIVRSTVTLQPYAGRRLGLLPQALYVLPDDQILRLDVEWIHRAPPFEVKYL
jgi:hypothetical protein